jgi:hypothetical protein
MFHARHHRRTLATVGATVLALAGVAGTAAAHPHVIGKNGQVIANGQNHPAFVMQADGTFLSCITNAPLPNLGPAWYGLETAHHGPDSGDAGRGDGCYLADSSPVGEADDVNPAID